MTQPVLGQVVISRAGRDKGRPFVIVAIYDEKYVDLVDGDLRRVEDPKKKNIRHVILTKTVIEELADKLRRGEKITDEEVFKHLASFRDGVIKREQEGPND